MSTLKDFLNSKIKASSGGSKPIKDVTATTSIIAKSGSNNLSNPDANFVDVNTFFTGICAGCITKRAETTASIPIYAVKYKSGKPEPVPDDFWLQKLIETPNSLLGINRKQFISLIVNWIDKTGNCYIYTPIYSAGKPVNCYILPTSKVKIRTSDTDLISGYIFNNNGTDVLIDKREICHIKTLEPNSNALTGLLYGTPYLIKSALFSILTEKEKSEFERKYYKREGIAPVFLKSSALTNYSDDALQRLKAELNEKLPAESPILGVITNDLSLESFDLSTKGSKNITDVKEHKKLIAFIFGIPFGIVDTESQQNKASASVNYASFRTDTIEPLLQLIEQSLTNHFLQYEPDIAIVHDEFVDKDETSELIKQKQYLDYGIKTRNEIRLQNGDLPLPLGDEPLISSSLTTWKKAETSAPATPAKMINADLEIFVKKLESELKSGEINFPEYAEKLIDFKKKILV